MGGKRVPTLGRERGFTRMMNLLLKIKKGGVAVFRFGGAWLKERRRNQKKREGRALSNQEGGPPAWGNGEKEVDRNCVWAASGEVRSRRKGGGGGKSVFFQERKDALPTIKGEEGGWSSKPLQREKLSFLVTQERRKRNGSLSQYSYRGRASRWVLLLSSFERKKSWSSLLS